MSRIRVDQLVNQNSSGPTLAVEGLKIPSTKNLEVDGSIVLGGNPGLNGQVISRTTSGLEWASVPLTDNNTTYLLTAVDNNTNAVTEKVIKLTANGGTDSEVVLIAGSNVDLTRDGSRITINSSYTDTDTITKIGANGANYTDGDVSFVGTGSATVTQQGRTITVNATDTNTTYTGINGVSIDSSNRIQIGQPVGASDAVQFAQLTITGNLVVQGTTTYNNVTTVTSTDKFIRLNDVLIPDDNVASGGGIILKGNSDHSILWSNTFDRWDTTENWNLVATREYQIGGSSVLSATSLGPNVTSSSLTSVGTLSSGIWNASVIGIQYGGTGANTALGALNALLPQQAANTGKFLTTDGTGPSWAAIPATYSGWTLSDTVTSKVIQSGQSVSVIGTGSTSVLLDNVNNKLTIDSINTQYTYTAVDGSINTEKNIRLVDTANNTQEIVIAAGTGVTLTRNSNKLTLSVAQDLSSNANPTFASLNVTGTLTAGTYEGDAGGMTGLTGASSGTYGSSTVIPIVTVDAKGRVTSISTAPNTGASAGTPSAGGQSNYIQYNNNGGLAGNSKFQFEPSSGKVELQGTLQATTLSSSTFIGSDVEVSNYIKLPNKTPSERDALVVQNGTIVYNTSGNTIDIYQDGSWKVVGPITLGTNKLGELQDVSSSTPSQGQVLKWNGSAWAPGEDLNQTGGGGIELSDLSAFTLNPGTSSLTYDSSSGVFAYTPPDLSNYITDYIETDPVFQASASASITSANITNWNAAHSWGNHGSQGYLTSLSSNVLADLQNVSNTAPSDGQVLKWSSAQGKWAPGTDNVGTSSSGIQFGDLSVSTASTPSSGGSLAYDNTNGTFTFTPAAVFDGSYNSLSDTPSLFSGSYNDLTNKPSLATVATTGSYNDLSNRPTLVTELNHLSDVDTTGAANGKILKYNGTSWEIADDTGGINDVVDDTTPQLGGNLDLAGNNITGTGAIDVVGNVKGTSITSGAVTFTGLDGNPGQVLTTNGSGAATWTTVSSGSTTGTLNDVTTNGATTANTITVGGLDLTSSNHKIRIGASNTFQIYNDGTSDRIDTSGSNLRITTTNTDLLLGSTGGITKITVDGSATGDLLAQFINSGAVELFHGGVKKIETLSTGAQVTGLINATTGIQIGGTNLNIGHLSDVSSTAPSPGQVLKWDGTNSEWAPATDLVGSGGGGIALTDLSVSTGTATGGGELTYDDSNGTFTFKPAVVSETDTLATVTGRGATTTDQITVNGLVSNSHITAGDGEEIRLGDTATGDFVITHSGAANVLGSPEGHNLIINGSSGATRAVLNEAGSVELYHSGTKKFETSATGISVSGSVTATGGSSPQWNTAYGWGDHSAQGYLTAYTESDTLDSVTGRGATTSNSITVGGNGSTGGVSLSDGNISLRTGTGNVASIDLYCEVNNAHKVSIKAPAHSNFSGNVNFTLPGSNGTNGYILSTDGSGNTSWVQQASFSETDTLDSVTTRNGSTSNSCSFGKLVVRAGTAASELELHTDNNNQYSATIKTPAASLMSGSTTFVLPPTNGSANQVLISDGYGNTSWSTLSGGGGGGSSVTVNDVAPGTPSNGDLWWNSNAGQLKIWYDDGSGSPSAQWVDAAGGGGSGSGGVTVYSGVANYPSASTMEGQLAYADDINAMHISDGTSWTNSRIVTTTNGSSSDFDTLLSGYEKTYALSINAHTAGNTQENNARKILKLVDNSGTDAGKFTINATTGLTTAITTDTWSNTSLDLGLDLQNVHNYTLTAETNAGAAASALKIQDSVRTINNEIVFAGADGITVERTDANTLTFRQGGSSVTQYTDAMAKDAAWNAINNGTHTGITWTYDSTNKYINATVTGGGGGGGGGYTYTLTGRNTTSNNAFIDLTDNAATPNVNSIEFTGSNGTDVDWDSANKKITINSKDYAVGANATASGSGGLSLTGSTFTYTPPDLSSFLTSIPQASATVLGGIKVGANLTIDAATGVLSANAGAYTLPTAGTGAAGTLGGVKVDGSTVTIDGNGVISSSGGTTTPSIGDVNATSSTIANDARGEVTVVGHKGYVLYKIHSSHEAWIRLYVDDATRQLDINRSEGEDPEPGSGVIAEVRTSGADQAVLITPGVMGFNNDDPRTENIYVSINNRSGSAATITVTLTVLKIGE